MKLCRCVDYSQERFDEIATELSAGLEFPSATESASAWSSKENVTAMQARDYFRPLFQQFSFDPDKHCRMTLSWRWQ